MNGIALLMPELFARMIYGILLIANGIVFFTVVLPKYKQSFQDESL